MGTETLRGLRRRAEIVAAAHGHAYRVFARAFEYPASERCAEIRDGVLVRELRDAARLIPGELSETLDWDALADAGEEDALAIEYTRLFDAGPGGPPCSLNGGIHGDARMKTMEEATRFYSHFGLNPTAEGPGRELPDHLTVELEFLHYLAYREAEALHLDADPGAFQRARRDFIERHPGLWLPRLKVQLERAGAVGFLQALTDALMRWLEHDHRDLVDRVGVAAALHAPG